MTDTNTSAQLVKLQIDVARLYTKIKTTSGIFLLIISGLSTYGQIKIQQLEDSVINQAILSTKLDNMAASIKKLEEANDKIMVYVVNGNLPTRGR